MLTCGRRCCSSATASSSPPPRLATSPCMPASLGHTPHQHLNTTPPCPHHLSSSLASIRNRQQLPQVPRSPLQGAHHSRHQICSSLQLLLPQALLLLLPTR
jgi:hypothetical protein